MKRGILLIITFVLLTTIPVNADSVWLTTADQECNTGNEIFNLYNYTNSHVAENGTFDSITDPTKDESYKVCSDFIDSVYTIQADQTCDGDDQRLFDLYKNNNSHVAFSNSLSDAENYAICGSVNTGELECKNYNTRTVDDGFIPILHLNGTTNSHAEAANVSSIGQSADTTNYQDTVACGVSPEAPTITIDTISNDTLKITVTDNSGGEAETFEVFGNTFSPPTTKIQTMSSEGSFNWINRDANQSYYVSARSCKGSLCSDNTTTGPKWTLATAPINLNSDEGEDRVDITWDAPGNPGDTVYIIYNSSGAWETWEELDRTTSKSYTHNLPSGSEGEHQCYTVESLNGENVANPDNNEDKESTCGVVPKITKPGLNAWFDPNNTYSPIGGEMSTWLFVENTGNTEDVYSINYETGDEIEINNPPENITVPAKGTNRVKIDYVTVISNKATLNATVNSGNDPSISEKAILTTNTREFGVPGIGFIEILTLFALSALTLLLIL